MYSNTWQLNFIQLAKWTNEQRIRDHTIKQEKWCKINQEHIISVFSSQDYSPDPIQSNSF